MIGSLFSGIGGLELGLEMCGLGPVIWQCDSDPHALAVLAHHWPKAIRYTDVRRIDATAQRPTIICGGFPCQDISNAGKRAGIGGERSGLWSEFARIVRVVRPQLVFVENVAALAARGLDRVLGDLAALGFDAEWGCFSAAEVGAPHIRRRLFVLAYAGSESLGLEHWRQRGTRREEASIALLDGGEGHVANANGEGELQQGGTVGALGGRTSNSCQPLADAHCARLEVGSEQSARGQCTTVERSRAQANTWSAEPDVGRVAHGIPSRAHRLRLLGNACVPQQAAHAFGTLMTRALRRP